MSSWPKGPAPSFRGAAETFFRLSRSSAMSSAEIRLPAGSGGWDCGRDAAEFPACPATAWACPAAAFADPANLTPHPPQYALSTSFSKPHLEQPALRRVPHALQKRLSSRFAAEHPGQIMSRPRGLRAWSGTKPVPRGEGSLRFPSERNLDFLSDKHDNSLAYSV